jgi:hypothetical protein
MSTTLEDSTAAIRSAFSARMAATPADDPKMVGYEPSCCEGERMCGDGVLSETYAEWDRLRGDGLTQTGVHPTSQAFFELCDALKDMHRRKSRDYGCPSGEDPLANIRNGAKFVGIPSWKGAMVRLSDKVTRLAAYNATGRLENESLEDNLFDLASYSLLALLLHREEKAK